MRRCLALLAAIAVVTMGVVPTAGAAATQKCGPYTVPAEVRISGVLGDAESFATSFRVKTSKKKLTPHFLRGTDLTSSSASISADRVQITNLSAPLPANESRAV